MLEFVMYLLFICVMWCICTHAGFVYEFTHTHTAGLKNDSTHSSVSKTINSKKIKKQDEESNEKLQSVYFYPIFTDMAWVEGWS